MIDDRKKYIDKFMTMRFGNLIKTEHKDGQYVSLLNPNTNKKIFLYEKKHEIITFSREYVTDPILSLFKTDYDETFEYVKNWLLEKYEMDCIDIVGEN
jgi:hypothetical protein